MIGGQVPASDKSVGRRDPIPTGECMLTERVAIVAAVRTPIGGYLGSMRDIPAYRLGALVLDEVVATGGSGARPRGRRDPGAVVPERRVREHRAHGAPDRGVARGGAGHHPGSALLFGAGFHLLRGHEDPLRAGGNHRRGRSREHEYRRILHPRRVFQGGGRGAGGIPSGDSCRAATAPFPCGGSRSSTASSGPG